MLFHDMFCRQTLLVFVIFALGRTRSEEKWVWGGGNDRTRIQGRYEIYEPNPEGFVPQRPIPGLSGQLNNPGNYYPQRPTGPSNYVPQSGPHQRPNNNNFGFDNGVLVGPSYGKGPFEYIDSCKCTERFNCRGIAYGSCDIGKQYCCVGRKSGPPPSRPVHSIENGILVGPGGPRGPSSRPGNPAFQRPFYPGEGGSYGGGAGSNPGFGIENGVLVGPGYRDYGGRSANNKE